MVELQYSSFDQLDTHYDNGLEHFEAQQNSSG